MVSIKPYLIRALHDWAIDCNDVPQITVDTSVDGVIVPQQFIADGRIVLNIHTSAVQELQMGNDSLSFRARFGGVPHNVSIPMDAIVAIFCRQSGRGLVFDSEASGGSGLTILGSLLDQPEPDDTPPKPPSGPSATDKDSKASDKTNIKTSKKGPPHLKVVK